MQLIDAMHKIFPIWQCKKSGGYINPNNKNDNENDKDNTNNINISDNNKKNSYDNKITGLALQISPSQPKQLLSVVPESQCMTCPQIIHQSIKRGEKRSPKTQSA